MKILAIECSAGPVSAAISSEGRLISNAFSNIKVTHSETLMPLVECVLKAARTDIKDIDVFAVSNGPGSFTGVRIGIAAVKGMAAPHNKPCCAVSTLLSMAERFLCEDAIICPVMDARRSQLYNALFKAENGEIKRLCADRALSCEELAKELSAHKEKIIVCGDGAEVFAPFVHGFNNVSFANGELKYQNATGVVLAAEKMVRSGDTVSAAELLPAYLRLPQAERELNEKLKKD